MRDILICPVCGNPLIMSGIQSSSLELADIYYCPKRDVWVPELEMSRDVIDCTLFINSDDKPIYKVIEIPPYIFTIYDYHYQSLGEIHRKTSVVKIIRNTLLKSVGQDFIGHDLTSKVRLFEIDAVMDLPWHDRDKILNKVKLYTLLS